MMSTKRKNLMEESYHHMKTKQMIFVNSVQERSAKMQTCLAPYFSNDLMFKIFLLLPARSLMRFTCVCKAWYKLIHCADFVEAYNIGADSTPILLRTSTKDKPNTFHVESQVKLSEKFCLFPGSYSKSRTRSLHFLELEGEKCKITDPNISCSGNIVASCNGLILIISMYNSFSKSFSMRRESLDPPLMDPHEKPGRLIVLNPLTRKFVWFPLGTLPNTRSGYYGGNDTESYGIVFSHSKGVFKVVHLIKDKSQYISCEILSLQTGSWKAVDGPGGGALRKFCHVPISAIGALHWLPDLSNINYIVSMDADNEKFTMMNLPKTIGYHDRLLEMGGFLSLVVSLDMDNFEVWILKGLNETDWIKQHTIRIHEIMGYVENEEFSIPVFALNAKEMVFRRGNRLFSYDSEVEEIREIEIGNGEIDAHERIIPHSNNLATWEPLQHMS